MARLVREAAGDAAPALRDRLLAHYRERLVRAERVHLAGSSWPWPDGATRRAVDDLEAGRPVVLAGWQLAPFSVPVVRRGVAAFYRVAADGTVVEVVARRERADRMSITGWDDIALSTVGRSQ